MKADAAIANEIRVRNAGSFKTSDHFCILPTDLTIFSIPKEITANIAPISMAVIACEKDIGVTFFNIQDEAVMLREIAGNNNINPTAVITGFLTLLTALTILFNPKEIATKTTLIKIAVIPCEKVIGEILDRIQDDTVIPIDTATNTIGRAIIPFTSCIIPILLNASIVLTSFGEANANMPIIAPAVRS